MAFSLNPLVSAIEEPPISEAHSWLDGVSFTVEKPLIDLAQAAPGYPPEEGLRRFLATAVMEEATSRYTDIEGLPLLRQLLATDMSETYQGTVSPEQVLIAAGCNQSFYLTAMTLCRPGDAMLVVSPWYFNHRMTLDMLGVEPVALPARAENGFVPDPQDARRLMTDRVKAILLISPNNPTGAVYPEQVLQEFADLAAEQGIALIVDETYRDFLAPEVSRPHGLIARSGWDSHLIHLYSFSKVYSMTGYRVGAVVADPVLITQIAKVMDSLAICAPRIGQLAAIFGLQNLHDWRAGNRQVMADRVAAFTAALEAVESGYEIQSIGAYFAFLRHPFEASSSVIAPALAREAGLLTLPDTMFGGAGTHLRVAFANVDGAEMPEVARRLRQFEQDHAGAR